MEIIRTPDEINDVLNEAADGENEGTRYPGMSYENGINNFYNWLVGNTDDPVFEEQVLLRSGETATGSIPTGVGQQGQRHTIERRVSLGSYTRRLR
jgi:hypothetical protein